MTGAFANPGALLFLAAAALPLLLYLLYRWRRRVRPWGAMRFLLAARREVRRRVEIQHIVLIVLRTLLVALVVLAFARPSLRGALGSLGERGGAVVLLVDSSCSMRASPGRRTRHAQALDLARDLVAGLAEGDEVSVVAFGAKPRIVVKASTDRAAVTRALASIQPTSEGTGLERAFGTALEILAASKARERAVVLVTDMQRGAWFPKGPAGERLGGCLREAAAAARVVLADVGDDGGSSVAVTALEHEDPIVARGMSVRIRARVANRTPATREVPVHLRVRGLPPLSETVRVEAGAEAEASWRVTLPEAGWREVEARASGSDALGADDARYLALDVREEVRALLVEGRSRPELFAGQADFLSVALAPDGDPEAGRVSPARVRVVGPAGAESGSFYGEDLVVLAGVGSLPTAAARRLESYVRADGALLVFVGPDVDRALYNREYYRGGEGFLAAPLGERVEHAAAAGGESEKEGEAAGRAGAVALDLAGSSHPAFEHLRRAQYGDASLGRVRRYLALEGAAEGHEATVILAYSDGAPYLVERALGRGRTLLCTTTAGADWNDLVARPFYAPLMQEILRYAAGARADSVEVGGAWERRLAPEEAGQSANVTLPSGATRALVVRAAEGGAVGLSFDETERPGAYTVDFGRGTRLVFAVNVPAEEGDLARVDAAELRDRYPAFEFDAAPDAETAGASVERALAGRDLALPLLWLALAAFLAEGVLTWRFGARRD